MLNSAEKRELNELVKNATANLPLLIRIVAKPVAKFILKKTAKIGITRIPVNEIKTAAQQFRRTPLYDGVKSRLSGYGIGQSSSTERSIGVGLEDDFPETRKEDWYSSKYGPTHDTFDPAWDEPIKPTPSQQRPGLFGKIASVGSQVVRRPSSPSVTSHRFDDEWNTPTYQSGNRPSRPSRTGGDSSFDPMWDEPKQTQQRPRGFLGRVGFGKHKPPKQVIQRATIADEWGEPQITSRTASSTSYGSRTGYKSRTGNEDLYRSRSRNVPPTVRTEYLGESFTPPGRPCAVNRQNGKVSVPGYGKSTRPRT